jgi:hypothetical protein
VSCFFADNRPATLGSPSCLQSFVTDVADISQVTGTDPDIALVPPHRDYDSLGTTG